MELNLCSKLLLEIRRLHAAGTSFGVSEQENANLVLAELRSDSPSLVKLITVVESDPGLSIAVIKYANCTVINGSAKKSMTARQGAIRIGLDGIYVAVRIYQAELLKRVVTKKCWKEHMSSAMNNVLIAGALSYKVAIALTGKRQDAEWALQLAVLYSLGMFAKIIAADSLQLIDSKENKKIVLRNNAIASQAVLIAVNASYTLISAIERIEEEEVDDVGVVAAKAGWGFLMGTIDSVSFGNIEINKADLKRVS